MKKLLSLPLVAALLTACPGPRVPVVDVPFPDGPSILHGQYEGTVSEVRADGSAPKLPATLTATASFVSNSQYNVNGTINMFGNTYSFTGSATGYNVTLTPQWSYAQPGIQLKADLFLGATKVGTFSGYTLQTPTNEQRFIVMLGSQGYSLELDRKSSLP